MEVMPMTSVGSSLFSDIDIKVDAGPVNEEADPVVHSVNKKLMRLHVDSKASTKRQSLMFDDSAPMPSTTEVVVKSTSYYDVGGSLHIRKFSENDPTRFPRIEEMSHFHYNSVEFSGSVMVALCLDENEAAPFDSGHDLLVQIRCKDKSWIAKRSYHDFVGFDRQVHRCLYDRRYSKLPSLPDLPKDSDISADMVQELQQYLARFSEVAGNNVNCGPILNWLEIDNHGNHLVVMEADDSAINVPAIAACCVIKRYVAQAPDEITLEVGEFLSVIDMPPIEETIWWRGKKGYEVGFFPSHCVEILGEKDLDEKLISQIRSKPVTKRRGKFITFLRFFFKARPSKDELMQHGILRERVFGCDLGDHLAHTGREIPLILEMCADVIEEYGMVDGIYRLSGTVSNLQRLRVAFDSDDCPPDLRDQKYLNDIHCISSLLKTYFRELPNPLFTYELYEKFTSAICMEDAKEKTVAFHHAIQRLPPPHYRTMEYLLRHLNYCSERAKETNMTAKNLAIVWSPNLVRPHLVDNTVMLSEIRTQAIIIEYMIRNVAIFFDKNLASAAIAFYPENFAAGSVDVSGLSAVGRLPAYNAPPKLISLEEARARVKDHRKVSATPSTETHSSSQYHKLRPSTAQPPKVAAAPVSPLPGLLSLEEAQARTKNAKRDSADLVDARSSTASSPRPKQRKWLGLFSKNRNTTSHDEALLSRANAGEVYRRKSSSRHQNDAAQFDSPLRSQSSSDIQEFKKPVTTPSLGYRTSSFTSFIGSQVARSPSVGRAAPLAQRDDLSRSSSVSPVEADQLRTGEFHSVVSVKANIVDSNEAQTSPAKQKLSFSVGEQKTPRSKRFISDSALSKEAVTTGADLAGVHSKVSPDVQSKETRAVVNRVRESRDPDVGNTPSQGKGNLRSSITVYRPAKGHKREQSVDSGTADVNVIPPSPDLNVSLVARSVKPSSKHERDFSLDSGAGDSLRSSFLPSSPDDEAVARDLWVRRSAQMSDEQIKLNSNVNSVGDVDEVPYKKYRPASSTKLSQLVAEESQSIISIQSILDASAKTPFQRSLSSSPPKQRTSKEAISFSATSWSPIEDARSLTGSMDDHQLRYDDGGLEHSWGLNERQTESSDLNDPRRRVRIDSLTRAARKKSDSVDVSVVDSSLVNKSLHAPSDFSSNVASNSSSAAVSDLPRRVPLLRSNDRFDLRPSAFEERFESETDSSSVLVTTASSSQQRPDGGLQPTDEVHRRERPKKNDLREAADVNVTHVNDSLSKRLQRPAADQTGEHLSSNVAKAQLLPKPFQAGSVGGNSENPDTRHLEVSGPPSLSLARLRPVENDVTSCADSTKPQAVSMPASGFVSDADETASERQQPDKGVSVKDRARHFSHTDEETKKGLDKKVRPRSEILSSFSISKSDRPASQGLSTPAMPVRAGSEKLKTRLDQEKDAAAAKQWAESVGNDDVAVDVPLSTKRPDRAVLIDSSNVRRTHLNGLLSNPVAVPQPKVAVADALSQSSRSVDLQYKRPQVSDRLVASTMNRSVESVLNASIASRESNVQTSATDGAPSFSGVWENAAVDREKSKTSRANSTPGLQPAWRVVTLAPAVRTESKSMATSAEENAASEFHRSLVPPVPKKSHVSSADQKLTYSKQPEMTFLEGRMQAPRVASQTTAANYGPAVQGAMTKTDSTSDSHRLAQTPRPVPSTSGSGSANLRSERIGGANIDRSTVLQPTRSVEKVAPDSIGAPGRWQVKTPVAAANGDSTVRETLQNTVYRDANIVRRGVRSEGDDAYVPAEQEANQSIFRDRRVPHQNDNRKSAPVNGRVWPLPPAEPPAAYIVRDSSESVQLKPRSSSAEKSVLVATNSRDKFLSKGNKELSNLSDQGRPSPVRTKHERARTSARPVSMDVLTAASAASSSAQRGSISHNSYWLGVMQKSMSENYLAEEGNSPLPPATASSVQIGNFPLTLQVGGERAGHARPSSKQPQNPKADPLRKRASYYEGVSATHYDMV